jgi:hypothetical protein
VGLSSEDTLHRQLRTFLQMHRTHGECRRICWESSECDAELVGSHCREVTDLSTHQESDLPHHEEESALSTYLCANLLEMKIVNPELE